MDTSNKAWNAQMIDNLMWEVDRERIMEIPLGCLEVEDKYVWHYAKNGNFSVRSCYHNIVATSGCMGRISEANGSGFHHNKWKFIWNSKVPPKVRVFLWRACSDILPTNIELFRRKIVPNPLCNRCWADYESTLHIMKCSEMSDIWGDLPFCLQDANINFPNFSAWLCYLHINLSREAFELAATVCWRIWYLRNAELFEGLKCVKNDIVGWNTNFLDEYRRTSICEAHSGTPRVAASKWLPPPAEIIKINFDAEYFQVAMVARNHNNQCVWWSIRKLQGRPKIADGEARAALHVVAIDRGWRKIMIEGDSLQVINALHRGVDGMESFGAIISECLSISKTFVTCSFSFVKRDGNSLAHSLVQQNVIDMMEDSILPHDLEKFI